MSNLPSNRLSVRAAALTAGASSLVLSFIAALILHPAFVLLWAGTLLVLAYAARYQRRWAAMLRRMANFDLPRARLRTAKARAEAIDVVFREVPHTAAHSQASAQ